MASDRGNYANSSVLVVEESRLLGKLIIVLVPEKRQCLPLCNYWVAFVEFFKSNLIYEWQVTLINIRSRAVNISYYMLQPTCCGSLVNNMSRLSSPIFKIISYLTWTQFQEFCAGLDRVVLLICWNKHVYLTIHSDAHVHVCTTVLNPFNHCHHFVWCEVVVYRQVMWWMLMKRHSWFYHPKILICKCRMQ